MTDEGTVVSWRAVVYGTPVISADGHQAGTVREVLGDDSEDIFHGLRVTVTTTHRDVMVAAEDIGELRSDAVQVTVSIEQLAGQSAYDETASYHLASVGRFRHHLGWKKDASSDEEPG